MDIYGNGAKYQIQSFTHSEPEYIKIKRQVSRDEFELEFSGSSKPKLWSFRAEPGHFNFRAETELTIPTIKKSQILFNSFFPQSFYYQKSCIMISINFMIIYLNFCSTKSVFIGE